MMRCKTNGRDGTSVLEMTNIKINPWCGWSLSILSTKLFMPLLTLCFCFKDKIRSRGHRHGGSMVRLQFWWSCAESVTHPQCWPWHPRHATEIDNWDVEEQIRTDEGTLGYLCFLKLNLEDQQLLLLGSHSPPLSVSVSIPTPMPVLNSLSASPLISLALR